MAKMLGKVAKGASALMKQSQFRFSSTRVKLDDPLKSAYWTVNEPPPKVLSEFQKQLPLSKGDSSVGLYTLMYGNKAYAGKDKNLPGRVNDHQRDIEKGRKTVGNAFHKDELDDINEILWPLPKDLDEDWVRYYEQKKINLLEALGYEMVNVNKAMNDKDFEKFQAKDKFSK